MRDLEEAACLSRWRARTVEVCVLCLGLASCAISIPSALAGCAVLAVVLCIASAAGVPWKGYLRKLALAGGFALVSVLPLSVEVVFGPGFELRFDRSGFQTAVLALARSVSTLSVTLLLVYTVPFPRLLALLRAIGLPEVLLELLATVHREIFLLDQTFSRLRKALACRDGGRGTRPGIQALGMGAAALFVHALNRSERIERAMASRTCVDGCMRRWEEPLRIRPQALLLALLAPVALAVLVIGGHVGS